MQSQLKGSSRLAPGRRRDQGDERSRPRSGEHRHLAERHRRRRDPDEAATGNTTLTADGGMDISSSGVAIHVDLTAGMTMTDVANAINAKNGAVTATTANGQLRLTATQTGAASAITISNVTGGAAAIGLDLAGRRPDASGTIDGNAFTSASNQRDLGDLRRHAQPDRRDGRRRRDAHGQPRAGRQRRDHDASCRTSSPPTTT